MRTTLILAALIGCGGDSAHDVVDCGGAWSGIESATKCERACAMGPACPGPPYDDICLATLPVCKQPNGRLQCSNDHIAVSGGDFGCCQSDGPSKLVFVECE